MGAVCLLVAGALVATLPGNDFSVSWTHSVAKTRWVEAYRVEGASLRLVEASIEGSGAGMEPPPDAVLRDGRWHWRPGRVLDELVLARSFHAADYALCTASGCSPLAELAGPAADGGSLVIRPCPPR